MSNINLIETERLVISRFEQEDLTDEYLSWLNDPEITKYSNQRFIQHNYESSRAYLESFYESNNLFLKIKEKSYRKNIGTLTAYISPIHATADLGILIGNKNYHSLGYGYEAWQAIVNYLFYKGLRKITAGTLVENKSMIKILEKNSMQLEGVKKEQEKFENRYVDIVLYAKFKK